MYWIAGIFTAAFDNQIEWLIVKGISDYADGAEGTAASWSNFASVMAASVAAHILSDPCVFRSWPNYGGNDVHTFFVSIFSLTCARLSCFKPRLYGEKLPWVSQLFLHFLTKISEPFT